MIGWHLQHPLVLWVGIPLLILAAISYRYFSDSIMAGRMIPGNARPRPSWLQFSVHLLQFAAVLAALIAWANPRFGQSIEHREQEGIAIVNVFDASVSMEAIDFGTESDTVSRMEGARRVLKQFVQQREHDQQGLVVFGERTFTLAPLTSDHRLVLEFAGQIHSGMAGKMTALGDAIALGVKRLKEIPFETKILVVLTDGKNNAGSFDPVEAAQLAADHKIKIYTIGVGTNGTAPFRVDTLFGSRVIMQPVEMDEAALKKIARRTGGMYFNANTEADLKTVYTEIDTLERTEYKAYSTVEYSDHYKNLLAIALSLATFASALSGFVLRLFPA